MNRTIVIFFIMIIISGCSFGKIYTDAIEQTEKYLMNEEFDQAMKSIQIALNEKPEDDVAVNIESGLLKYQELQKYKAERDWDNVSDTIDSFGTLDSVHPKLKKQVDETKKYMLEQINLERQVSNELTEVKSDIDNHSFKEANALLKQLETNKNFKFSQKEITSMRKEYDKQFKQFKKEENIAERKKELNNLLLKYETELIEAEKIEKKISKNNRFERNVRNLNKAEATYDNVLNKIYQSIIKEFPEKEENLREVQREWLMNYEEEMIDTRYSSGEFEALEISIKMKKKRTKELLNEFF